MPGGRGRGGVWSVLALLLCCTAIHAASHHRQKRQSQLRCVDKQTLVSTPYLYVDTDTADCATLLSEMPDYYDANYRQTCQYWQGGPLPDQIEDAEVTVCADLANGTTKYRVQVCCIGATTDLRCFSCDDSTATLDPYVGANTLKCNHYGTGVQTCGAGQVCMSDIHYPRYGYGVYTKRCEERSVCEARMDPARCQSGVSSPACTYCCDTPYCNYEGNIKSITPSGPGGQPCSPNPCDYGGTCVTDLSQELGFTCNCEPGFSGPLCKTTSCSGSNPCKNSGYCFLQFTAPYYNCGCMAAHRGVNCTIDAGLCATNACQNGGTCYDHLDFGSRCVCSPEFVGSECAISVPQECPVAEHVFTLPTVNSVQTDDSCTDKLRAVQSYPAIAFISPCVSYMAKAYGLARDFRQGTNGNVPSAHGASIINCQKGDSTMFYQTTICCPACLSNPCQNNGWCQQHGLGHYTCKCRSGYGGDNCQFKENICYASGDPHFYSFDGQSLNFQGPCKYTMARSTDALLSTFEVLVKHEYRAGSTAVAYVKYVEVIFDSNTVKIDTGKVVTVNGVSSAAGGQYSGFMLANNGRFLRLETDFGLVVESDGAWTAVVKVPDVYNSKVEGLCGNFDGNSGNDLTTRAGVDVQQEVNAHTLFGSSWQVLDNTDPTCRNPIGDPPVCGEPLLSQVKATGMCGIILDNTRDNPLFRCVKNSNANADQYFESCVYDACANQDGGDIENVVCKSIEAFAARCKDLGYVGNWRAAAGCSLICPINSQFVWKTSACQATCGKPTAADECTLPDTENCVCERGYVMENNECIRTDQCGCLDANNVRHEIDSEWRSSDCAIHYRCAACTDCSSGNMYEVQEIRTAGCTAVEICELEDGAHTCTTIGCDVGGSIVEVGTVWQSDDCSQEGNCTREGSVFSPLTPCAINEKCTVVGPNQYQCLPNSCHDPNTDTHHELGDTWLSEDCALAYVCGADGVILSESHTCPSLHECKLQGGLHMCIEKTCQDEKGGVREVGSRWTSLDCSYYADCLADGIHETAISCSPHETCEAGDLGQCVPVASSWGAWGPWGACSGRCGSGNQLSFRTCQPVTAVCTGSSTKSQACVCDQKFKVADCDKCKTVDNILGYLPDQCDCEGYIQCQRVHNSWIAHHKKCGACTEWSQTDVTCVHVNHKCEGTSGNGYTVEQKDESCINSGSAHFRQHATDDKKYEWEVSPGNWLAMPCSLGTYFNKTFCNCINDPLYRHKVLGVRPITCLSFELTFVGSRNIWANGYGASIKPGLLGYAAYFSGGARVEVPYFTNRIDFTQLSVSLWFKSTDWRRSGAQGILSNGDCTAGASVEILSATGNTLSASIQTQQGSASITGMTAESNQWHHVVIVYTGRRLTVYVDNQLYSTTQTVGGKLLQKHCPLMIGGTAAAGFTGFIDQVCFYSDALDESDVLKLYVEGKEAADAANTVL